MDSTTTQKTDQAVTLNKSLAWTMVVGLITGSAWLGAELKSSRTQLDTITGQLTEMKAAASMSRSEMQRAVAEMDSRLRVVETSRATDTAEISTLRRDIVDMRNDFRELRADIQQLTSLLRNRTGAQE